MTSKEESLPVELHHACDNCGSSDAATTYDDGHTYCFSCGQYTSASPDYTERNTMPENLLPVDYKDLSKRGINEQTCRKYDYGFSGVNPRYQTATYRRKGVKTSQHLRDRDKNFKWVNQNPGLELFGQHLWEEGGKQLIITEGEIDCLTWAQVRNNKWPVVAVPGVSSIKMIRLNSKWIRSFDEVILYFDMDEPGQKFAAEVAAELSPTTVRIGNTGVHKDSNDMFLSEGAAALYNTLYQAKTWAPTTLVSHSDALTVEEKTDGLQFGLQVVDNLVGDIYPGHVVMIGAGSNIGKSLLIKHLASSVVSQGFHVLFFPLEEGVTRVAKSLTPLIKEEHQSNITYYKDEGLPLLTDITNSIEYAHTCLSIKFVFIDHITSVFNRTQADVNSIDKFLQDLQAIAERLGVVIVYNSHVKDPSNGSYDDGHLPQSDSFRGSGMLYRIPDVVLVLGRAITDEDEKHITTLMCLKHRDEGLRVGKSVEYTLKDNMIISYEDSEIDF